MERISKPDFPQVLHRESSGPVPVRFPFGSMAASPFLAHHPIPVDYSITKGHLGGDLTAYGSYDGLLVFQVRSFGRVKTLLDASGSPLITAASGDDGQWQGFRGNSLDLPDLIFTVRRTLSSLCTAELEVFLVEQKSGKQRCRLKLKGSPFHRSCTMYLGDSIVAQSNLKYKLRTTILSRHKFRLTIYPGVRWAGTSGFCAWSLVFIPKASEH